MGYKTDILRKENISQAGMADFEAFLEENTKKVNLMLNRILMVSILIGPLIMLAVRFNVFHGVTYMTGLLVSLLVLMLTTLHRILINRGEVYLRAAFVAFFAIDILLILMNSAHIGIYLTWFVVPIMSLLFCNFKIYAVAVIVNYFMMAVSVWLVAPYYAELRNDFDKPLKYFIERMSGFSIETVIMVFAGYSICKISTGYYRELIEKYKLLSDNKQRLNEQMVILESMSEIYDYVNLMDLDNMTETTLRGENRETYRLDESNLKQSHLNSDLMKYITKEQKEAFRAFTDINSVTEKLIEKKSIDEEFVNTISGWFRAQYIVVERRIDGTPKSIIYTIQNVDEQKRREEHLLRMSMTDELTRLYNRRCYDNDMEEYSKREMEEDFVIFSIDINGLKPTNDTKGHTAGDELIKAAAGCLSAAFGSIGKAYRTGGDEFLAVAGTDNPQKVADKINRLAEAWKGEYADSLSMSVGYAAHMDYPDADIHELEKYADKMMYREKGSYYTNSGVDRRKRD